MQIAAEKVTVEQTENNIERLKTTFLVRPGETVEELMKRLKVDGTCEWHFDEAEVTLRLIKE